MDSKSESAPRNLAVLVGNGLSVAFNPSLNLRIITQEMTERISRASEDGTDVVAAMKEIASRALPDGATTDDDFELLVGAFGSESTTLGHLHELALLVAPLDENLRAAIVLVTKFAERVRDTGLSHVLEVIFERSHGSWPDAQSLHSLVEAITVGFDGRVAFANLNYDTLLLSALLSVCQADLADMANGWKDVTISNDDGSAFKVARLRRKPSDFPSSRRVQLLHLHGSLTYWTDRDKDIVVKVDTSRLAGATFWEELRNDETRLRPVVVLANQRDKSAQVTEFPFVLAYQMFERGLSASNYWFVVGYSFRDQAVNALLRSEFAERVSKPRVLVVTLGDVPSSRDVERAFGWNIEDGDSSSWLTINRQGADGVEDSSDWETFCSEAEPIRGQIGAMSGGAF